MSVIRVIFVFLFFAFLMAVNGPVGGDALAANIGNGTGLPLPRFVSLRAAEANLRTGPGLQYPVDWVYTRPQLPVQIIAEHKTWRKIRDSQGTQGWVHQSMLTGKRTVTVTGKIRVIREKPDVKSAVIARIEGGVIARLKECPDGSGWCRIESEGYEGWLRRPEIWGVLRGEVVK